MTICCNSLYLCLLFQGFRPGLKIRSFHGFRRAPTCPRLSADEAGAPHTREKSSGDSCSAARLARPPQRAGVLISARTKSLKSLKGRYSLRDSLRLQSKNRFRRKAKPVFTFSPSRGFGHPAARKALSKNQVFIELFQSWARSLFPSSTQQPYRLSSGRP